MYQEPPDAVYQPHRHTYSLAVTENRPSWQWGGGLMMKDWQKQNRERKMQRVKNSETCEGKWNNGCRLHKLHWLKTGGFNRHSSLLMHKANTNTVTSASFMREGCVPGIVKDSILNEVRSVSRFQLAFIILFCLHFAARSASQKSFSTSVGCTYIKSNNT